MNAGAAPPTPDLGLGLGLDLERDRRPLGRAGWAWGLFGLWCVVVLVGTARHEYWRDEVRAYSFARDAHTLPELVARLQDEGHPMLWHLLLHAGAAVTGGSPLVLPAASLGVAAGAVALFLFRCPLPVWLKGLFVLGGLPLYEYSVVARNYGISMLLLFGFAALYPRRKQRAVALGLGVVLAALANTNVHALLLAVVLLGTWLWEDLVVARMPWRTLVREGAATGPLLAAATLGLGVGLALATLWPSDGILPSDPSRYTAGHVLRALVAVLRDPAYPFRDLVPRVPGLAVTAVLANAVLIWATLSLVGRSGLLVAAWAAVVALGVLFAVVYPGGYRHQGLWLVFLLTLTWIRYEPPAGAPLVAAPASDGNELRRFGGLGILLAIALCLGGYHLVRDLAYPQSASRAFGAFLHAHPEFASATLVGEPDFLLESLPYYADNPIYIAREQRFGDTIHFTRASQARLGLGELLRTAWSLCAAGAGGRDARNCIGPDGRRILVALGHLPRFDPSRGVDPTLGVTTSAGADDVREIAYSYGRTFSWSSAELAAWRASTVLVARFDDHIVGDERYAVYEVLRPPPPTVRPSTGAP